MSYMNNVDKTESVQMIDDVPQMMMIVELKNLPQQKIPIQYFALENAIYIGGKVDHHHEKTKNTAC